MGYHIQGSLQGAVLRGGWGKAGVGSTRRGFCRGRSIRRSMGFEWDGAVMELKAQDRRQAATDGKGWWQ